MAQLDGSKGEGGGCGGGDLPLTIIANNSINKNLRKVIAIFSFVYASVLCFRVFRF